MSMFNGGGPGNGGQLAATSGTVITIGGVTYGASQQAWAAIAIIVIGAALLLASRRLRKARRGN
jgi:hypothetical protein